MSKWAKTVATTRAYKVLFLQCLLMGLLLSVQTVRAEVPDLYPQLKGSSVQQMAGNWLVTLMDENGKQKHLQHIVMSPPLKSYCEEVNGEFCVFRLVDNLDGKWNSNYYGDGNIYNRGWKFTGENSLEYFHAYGITGHWGADSNIVFKIDAGKGQWNYRGRESGPEIWKRFRPVVKEMTFSAVDAKPEDPENSRVSYGTVGRVTGVFDKWSWSEKNYFPGNRPFFWINIYGDNLWGFHTLDIKNSIGFDPLGYCSPIREKNSGKFDNLVGLSCGIRVWPGSTRGTKILRLDNIEIPFDFDITGLPEDSDRLIIGDIGVNYTHPELMKLYEKSQLDGDIAAINRRLKPLNDKIDAINVRGKQLGASEQKRLKPYEDALDAVLNPTLAKDKRSTDYTNREFRIKTHVAQASRLMKAFKNVQSQLEGTSEKAVRVRQDLENRVGEIRLELLENQAALDRELEAKLADDIRLGVSIDPVAYNKANDQYADAKRDSARKLRIIANELKSYESTRRDYLAQIEQLKMKAAEKVSELKGIADRGVISLERIETPHAQIRFDFDFQELKDINTSVAETARALKVVTDQRERARDELIDAVAHADASADSKIFATYASTLGQVSLDALMQIKDVADAGAKGGPPAALAEAISKISSNLFDWGLSGGPKVYEADPTLAWYDASGAKTAKEKSAALKKKTQDLLSKKQKQAEEHKAVVDRATGTAATAAKTVQKYIKTGIQTHYSGVKLKEMLADLPVTDGVRPNSLNEFLQRQFKQQMKDVSDARTNWNDMRGKTSRGGFLTNFAKSATKGIVDGIVVNRVKKQIAQMFESGPMRDYLDAQLQVGRSVEMFRKLGDIYWDQKASYDLLVKRRDDLLEGLEIRKRSRIVLEENLPFEPEPSYTFRLYYMGREARHQIDADVWVAGKKLQPAKHPNSYQLGEKLATYLKDADFSTVPVEIRIH
ncbi:MAG: hypothetical protein OQK12_17380 [Motiliproteus sp.]|nr:hypothetical protein [Motiliproteus sp.]MCW9054297.1 hypothetical protein [Motiliproteus sp.]